MDSEDALNFSALAGIKPLVETYPLEKAAEEVGGGISLTGKGLTQKDIDRMLDVRYSLESRKAAGGPAPEAVRAALGERRKQHHLDAELVDKKQAKLRQAKEHLIAEARRLVA